MTGNLGSLGLDFFDDLGGRRTIQEIGEQFGGILAVPSMPLVQTLTPRKREVEPGNTYSGNFGYDEFPAHTDMAHWFTPPRFIVMRCRVPDESVATTVVKASKVLPDFRTSQAKRSLFKPRRRLDFKSYLLRVSEPHLYRWDSLFIRPASDSAKALKAEIELKLKTVVRDSFSFSREGQVLILDNWAVLHGRTNVPSPKSERVIERIYLKRMSI